MVKRMEQKDKHCRSMAAFLCVVILLITLVSSVYIVCEAGHECIGDNCPVCSCLQQAEKALSQLGTAAAHTPTVHAVCVLFVFEVISFALPVLSCDTLISQKIRLNN